MGRSRKPKKSYEDLVDDIVGALPVQMDTTIGGIARAIGHSWSTTDRWIQLIIRCQKHPRIIETKSPYGRGYVYRRERAIRSESKKPKRDDT